MISFVASLSLHFQGYSAIEVLQLYTPHIPELTFSRPFFHSSYHLSQAIIQIDPFKSYTDRPI